MKISLGIAVLVLILTSTSSCKKVKDCPQGPANPNCTCPGVVNYVCGCNHQTYENACLANCDGITTYTMGRCP